MTDTPKDQETLWRDLFEDGPGPRSLETLLKEVRRQRRKRANIPLILAAAAMVAIALTVWWATPRQGDGIDPPPLAEGNPTQVPPHEPALPLPPRGRDPGPPRDTPVEPQSEKRNAYAALGAREITDEELLERIKGWPIALVGPKGQRRAVFLEPTTGD